MPTSSNNSLSGVYEGPTKLDPNEVERVQFFSLEEIRKMVEKKEKIHPECVFGLKKYFL